MASERITLASDLQTIEYLPATLRGWLANDLSLHAAALHNLAPSNPGRLQCSGWHDEGWKKVQRRFKTLND